MPHPTRPPTVRASVALAVLTLLAAFGVATGTAAAVADPVDSIGPGGQVGSGRSLTSAANGYRLTMGTNGDLVLLTDHQVPLWSSGTAGRGASSLTLQTDGNLVVRSAAGTATWVAGTRGSGATSLSVQGDGNVVLRAGTRAVWCTCSVPFHRVTGRPASLTVGQGLLGGDLLAAGTRTLSMQTDGNLVLRGPAGATWATGTRVAGGLLSTFSLQGDGNLVLRGPDKRALWNSGTAGRGGRTLLLGTDGSLRLLTAGGGTVWSVGTTAPPTGIAGDVFALVNRERAAHGLPALTSDARLITSAARHNAAMSAANTLSHQLPGEADPGARMTAVGYTWRDWAENIAWTTVTTSAGAQALQTAMYDETPPADGHRQNILSRSVTQVGVAVLVDARGKLWLTTDFAAPR